MPKEIIKYTNDYIIRNGQIFQAGLPEGMVTSDDKTRHTTELALHWSKGESGMVQLSVQLDAEMVRAQLAVYDKQEWLGEEIKPGMLMFYTEPMERGELQRMVRHGRRSRDDVFGTDE